MANRRTIVVNVTCRVEVSVPGDSPLLACDPEAIALRTVENGNDASCGRYSLSAEMLHDGAERVIRRGLRAVLFRHHTERIGLGAGTPPGKERALATCGEWTDRDSDAATVRAAGDLNGEGPLFVVVKVLEE